MMYEELYIIKEGARYRVDLKKPSGITLNFKSQMFGDLSKITCSHSYTFTLPLTLNNRRVFDNAEDIRISSTMVRKRHLAEFRQNGIDLFKEAYLYIEETAGEYKAVMTWAVVKGMENLKNNDISLKELPLAGLTADYGGEQKYISEFSNTRNYLNPMYGCGLMPYWDVTGSRVNLYYPLPVVPIYKIVEWINAYFGTSFKLGVAYGSDDFDATIGDFVPNGCSELINRGVLPLVGVELTEEQLADRTTELSDFSFSANSRIQGDVYEPYKFLGLSKETLKVYDCVLFNLTEANIPDLITGVNIYDEKYYTFCSHGSVPSDTWGEKSSVYELDGYLIASFEKVEKVSETALALPEAPTLSIYHLKYQAAENDEDSSELTVEEADSIDGEPYSGAADDAKVYYIFDFRQSNGKNRLSIETASSTAYPLFFAFNFKLTSISSPTPIRIIPVYDATIVSNYSRKIDIASNLPDISCMTFMKSLFLMIGAYPIVTSEGDIVPSYFSDLEANVAAGHVVDWSNKIVGCYGDLPSEVKYSVNGLKRKNYYLMKSDDLNKTEEDEQEETDVYEGGYGYIAVDDETLDETNTVIQYPYYAPYVKNKSLPELETGNTFKAWYLDSGVLKWTKPKPSVGIITAKPERQYLGAGDALDADNYSETGAYYEFMQTWNGSKNITDNPSYAYLQQIVEKPIVITVKAYLNEFDLRDLDYRVPVYIDRYNALFAIISIARDSNGLCKCELIKLP